ncbi:LysR family transcriptional regulator [Salipiger sp.]|uniref:LysR family transcriptional regulator n=1 Tax=Salipiger sp. TaxID=2078585 RepID=UPI003A9867C6
MDLRQLRQVVVLAETLSFRETAERLNMTQPPLSVSIRKLEESLGVTLFDRTTHSVRLTDAGRAILADARRALFHADEVRRVARDTVNGLAGQLRIGFVGSAKASFLPRVLPAYRKIYPNVALHLSENSNTAIVEGIVAGQIDIGIVRSPFIFASELNYTPVEDDVFVVVLPRDHPLASEETIDLTELRAEPMVQYTQYAVPGLHSLAMMLLQEAGVNPVVSQVAEQVHTVICLVEAGLGWSIVPSTALLHATDRVIFKPIEPQFNTARISLSLAYHPNYETAAAQLFRDCAGHHSSPALLRQMQET